MRYLTRKSNDIVTPICRFAFFAVAVVALILGAAVPELWADEDEEAEFDEAELFFELNDTDGDLGIQALIDGDAWKRVMIEDTRERKMLDVRVRGRLRQQGLTELCFESAEPGFDELAPEDFFKRFPAGEYEIEGITLEGEELESEVELTHVMPAAPENATVTDGAGNKFSFPEEADECDDDLPTITGDVTVEWSQVTTWHKDIGAAPENGETFEVIRYQVVAEWEDDDVEMVASYDLLPPDNDGKMSVTFPAQFFENGAETKFEILVREESYNLTAIESCPFEYVVNP